MVQEFHVLKCFSCETFQSHIVKKTNKWECKVCGNKQSIKKVYGQGSGKDCRLHTQKLNTVRGEKDLQKNSGSEEEDNEARPEQLPNNQQPSCIEPILASVKPSKWTEYVKEDKIETANNCLQQGKNKPVNNVSSKIKRKIDRDLLHCEDHYSISTEIYGSLNDDISFGSSVLTGTTKKAKTYHQSNNSDCKVIESYNFEIDDENNETVKSFNINQSKQHKTNFQAKISQKWGKYLVDKPEIEKDLTNDSVLSVSSGDNASFREKEIEPASTECTYIHLGMDKGHKNLFNSNNKYISFKPCNTFRNQQRSITSLCPRREYDNECIQESDKYQEKEQCFEKEQTNRQALVPKSIFEQDCDLNDIDFQLDF